MTEIIFLTLSFFKISNYIDPGSLSAFMAVIIGALAGIGMTLKLYWHKIRLKLSQR
ncbi:hypothetical protein OAO63_01955 [Nitrosopumilus sp.]|nr:hypothetical protein [Nitrosopumilus sp.]